MISRYSDLSMIINTIERTDKSKKDECAKGLIFDSKLNSVVSKKIRNKSLPR